jgi:hypothetical protein
MHGAMTLRITALKPIDTQITKYNVTTLSVTTLWTMAVPHLNFNSLKTGLLHLTSQNIYSVRIFII